MNAEMLRLMCTGEDIVPQAFPPEPTGPKVGIAKSSGRPFNNQLSVINH